MPSPTQDEEVDRILGQMRVDLLLSSAMPNGSPGYPHAFESDPVGNGAQSRAKAALHRLMLKERRKAVAAAISKDPLECEYGHKVYSHKTADGWCCACDADIAFLTSQIEGSKSDE